MAEVTRCTLEGEFTFEAAKQREDNFLLKLKHYKDTKQFIARCLSKRGFIEAAVAHHVGTDPSACEMEDNYQLWLWGSFNMCIPVKVQSSARVMFRLPLPFRVGHEEGDEKIRCEAGAYAWLRRECPSLPVPHLYGFGLSSGRCYTSCEHLPFWARMYQRLRHLLIRLHGKYTATTYVPHPKPSSTRLGPYLVIEYIEESRGNMLPSNWCSQASEVQRSNFFASLSRILLSLAQVRLPKIGSFTIDDSGFLRLANRPLTLELQMMECEGIPRTIPMDRTYATSEAYVMDLLQYHDNRLRYQPNAINHKADGLSQMSALTLMRAVIRDYIDANPTDFIFTLTDLSPSNIFVDKDWNITCIIDLEWAASLPVGWQTPSWLTGQAADEISPSSYEPIRNTFIQALKHEELEIYRDTRYSVYMDANWKHGTFWYTLALRVPSALHYIFYNWMQPRYCEDHADNGHFYLITSQYWAIDANDLVEKKIKDKAAYDIDLRKAFT